MLTRQEVWSDPKVQALIPRFIPVADDIDRIGTGSDPASQYKVAINKLPQWTDPFTGATSNGQGVYAFSPKGTPLGWMTSNGYGGDFHNPAEVLRMMKGALEKMGRPSAPEARPAAKGGEPAMLAERNFLGEQYAADAVVLRVNSRDLPRKETRNAKSKWSDAVYRSDLGLTYVGFTAEEARQFLPSEVAKGVRHEVPGALAARLSCKAFIDNVHGTAPRLGGGSVKKARLSVRVVDVREEVASVRFEGETLVSDETYGYGAKVLGTGDYSLKDGKWVALELVAVGSRWGAVHHSGRGPWGGTPQDTGPAPMGVVCVLTSAAPVAAEERTPDGKK